jgi:CBS domain containing-hemolysin-like protein
MLALLVAVALIAVNGFFVAAEFAIVKARVTELRTRMRRGDKRAARAEAIVKHLDRYLTVCQFGVTAASLGLGWVGEPALISWAERGSIALRGEPLGEDAHAIVDAGGLALLTFAHVLLGELVPKFIAIQRSHETMLRVALPLRIVNLVFRPLLWLMEKSQAVVLRLMGMTSHVGETEGSISEEEILAILAANARLSPTGRAKSELVDGVLRFAQRSVRHAMIPRVDVASLPIDTPPVVAIEFLRRTQYSRILLTRERSLDQVKGYLYAKDLILRPDAGELASLAPLRRDVLFVPESRAAVDVLRDMQRAQSHIAVVVDEYGGTSGIVTLEDLIEEVMGEIRDELDESSPDIVPVQGEPRTWDVSPSASIAQLERVVMELDQEDRDRSVAQVIISRLGRPPRTGDCVPLGEGVSAELTEVTRRRIVHMRVRSNRAAEVAGIS